MSQKKKGKKEEELECYFIVGVIEYVMEDVEDYHHPFS